MTDDPLRAALAEALHDQFAPIACVSDQDIHTFAECDIKDHWLSRGGDAAAHPAVLAILAGSDDPDLDGTDGAHPAWWRGCDYGYRRGLAALAGSEPAGLDPRRLTDAINAVLRKQPSLAHVGFVYGETGAAIAREYAALAATPTASPRLMTMRVGPTAGGRRRPDPVSEPAPTAGGECEYDCDACREAAEMTLAAISEQDESA